MRLRVKKSLTPHGARGARTAFVPKVKKIPSPVAPLLTRYKYSYLPTRVLIDLSILVLMA